MNVVQNDLISIVILFILVLGMYKQVNHKDPVYGSFLVLLILNGIILLMEMLIFVLSGLNGPVINALIFGVAMLYYLLIPIILMMTFVFFDFHFHSEPYNPKSYIIPFSVIFIINLVLLIVNMSQGIMFNITSENVFETGSMYVYYELIIYGIFTLIFLHAIMQSKNIGRHTLLPLILFMIPITAAVILVMFTEFVFEIWNAYMVALFIIYTFVQLEITSTDFLTGLKNRRGFEYLLFNLNHTKTIKETVVGIMIDIDNFKAINDKYGHNNGDKALKAFSRILKNAVRKNDFVSRTGGDEFAIIIQANETDVGDIVVHRIKEQLEVFNKNMPYGYKLHVSIGSDVYIEEKYKSIADFFEYLDQQMYKDKKEHNKVIT